MAISKIFILSWLRSNPSLIHRFVVGPSSLISAHNVFIPQDRWTSPPREASFASGRNTQARHVSMDFDNRLIWIFVRRSLTIESRLSDYFKSFSRWIWSFKSLYLRKTFFVSFGNAVDISDFHCLLWFDVPMWLVAIWMWMILDVPSDIKAATMIHLGSGAIWLSIDIALTSISLTAIRLKGLPASNSVW